MQAEEQPKPAVRTKPIFRFKPSAKVAITVASEPETSEYTAGEQTSDITTLTRAPVDPAPAPSAAPTVKPVAKAPKKVAVAAPAPAPAPAPKEVAEVQKAPIDISKYDEPLQEIALDILGTEHDNPYKKASTFPLHTRLGFQKQILKVYSDFIKIPEHGKELDFDACKKLGVGAQQEIQLYEYQKFVREYIRQASPYRGLLVYHGLGSGKTCSAIAAAEALFSVSNKKIIVMTPFSLRDNFIREVSSCGFRHYRLQNFWVKLDGSNPLIKVFAKEVLNLPAEFANKATDIWVPDFKQEPNFSSLDDSDRQQIQKQLVAQITSRIEFINYNGITASRLKEIACRPADAAGYGYFDNKVIVVDEIHNLTRLMQGTIEPYLTSIPGLRRKVQLEPVTYGRWEPALCKKATDPRRPYLTNYKRGYLLYRLLAGARNSKIIGLSGTPLINFPEEIAILVNLLGGYIHTANFTVGQGQAQSADAARKLIKDILLQNPFVDFEEVELLGMNVSVTFTLLPEGMKKVTSADGVGVQRLAPGVATPSIKEVMDKVLATLAESGIRPVRPAEIKSEALLPPVGKEFREYFLNADGTTLVNDMVLRKRLQGLISYYRGSKKELMPTVTVDTVVRVPFTPYAQAQYSRVRSEELKKQLEKKKKKSGDELAAAGVSGKMGNLWAELYDLAKMQSSNSYRMFSRQGCNFAFPEGIVRPRPTNQDDIMDELGREDDTLDMDGDGFPSPNDLALPPATEGEAEDAAAAAAEDAKIDESAKEAAQEEARAEGDEDEAEEIAKEGESVLIAEQAPVPAEPIAAAASSAGPAAAASLALAVAGEEKKTLSLANAKRAERAKLQEQCKRGLAPGEKYLVATERAKECLRTFASPKLRLYDPSKSIAAESKAGTPIDPTRLQKYSPKYAAILERILNAPGSSLVYSQFLDMEGIGIFTTVLRINEFEPIVIELGESGMRFSAATIASLKKGSKVNRYLSFTGTVKREVRSMALRVFNARFSEGNFIELPPDMSEVLVSAGFTGNLHGELCRVFCITSAGAEGLSLRNVRRVHIMDPYWNHVRTDQVKGRAVRICSHIDLEYNADPALNERTVEVFTYCSTFDPQALLHPSGDGGFPQIDQTILNGDGIKPTEAAELGFPVPAGITDYVMTSDEYLLQLSERKKKLLQNIQDLMKTSAVDCQINQYENEEDGLGCISIAGNTSQYAYHPNIVKDIAETSTTFKETVAAPATSFAAPAPAAGPASGPTSFAPAAATSFAAGPTSFAPAAAGPTSFAPAAAGPTSFAAKPSNLISYEIRVNKVDYLAIAKLEKGQSQPLQYDIYARGDIHRIKKLGITLADDKGLPTANIMFI